MKYRTRGFSANALQYTDAHVCPSQMHHCKILTREYETCGVAVDKKLRRIGEWAGGVINFIPHDLRDFFRFSFGERVGDHFKKMDKDKSGHLSKKEFRAAVELMGFKSATKESVDAAFSILDDDHSGKIQYIERECSREPKRPLPVHRSCATQKSCVHHADSQWTGSYVDLVSVPNPKSSKSGERTRRLMAAMSKMQTRWPSQ